MNKQDKIKLTEQVLTKNSILHRQKQLTDRAELLGAILARKNNATRTDLNFIKARARQFVLTGSAGFANKSKRAAMLSELESLLSGHAREMRKLMELEAPRQEIYIGRCKFSIVGNYGAVCDFLQRLKRLKSSNFGEVTA